MRDRVGPPWNETPVDERLAVDIRSQLAAFNEVRRQLLGGKPINREGEEVLMPRKEEE